METIAELNRRWVAQLRLEDAEVVAALRGQAGVEVAIDGSDIWVRGTGGGVFRELANQPVVQVFESEDDVLLHPTGERVPTDQLPAGLSWSALGEVTRPIGMRSILPGATDQRVTLKLVSSSQPKTVNLLRLNLPDLVNWVERAPAIRFDGLKYACSEKEVILVMGAKLPSLSAERFVATDGLAVPAGWQLDPPVSVRVVKSIVGAPANSIVMINRDGTAETIELNHFVNLSRASVRLTAKREHDG